MIEIRPNKIFITKRKRIWIPVSPVASTENRKRNKNVSTEWSTNQFWWYVFHTGLSGLYTPSNYTSWEGCTIRRRQATAPCIFHHAVWPHQRLLSKFLKEGSPTQKVKTQKRTFHLSHGVEPFSASLWDTKFLQHSLTQHIYTEGSNILGIVRDTGNPEGNKQDPEKQACPGIGVSCLACYGMDRSTRCWSGPRENKGRSAVAPQPAMLPASLHFVNQWSGNHINMQMTFP